MRTVLTVALCSLLAAARPPEQAFSDRTRESGIEEGVVRHWRDFPKVWLSGMTLVKADAVIVIEEP